MALNIRLAFLSTVVCLAELGSCANQNEYIQAQCKNKLKFDTIAEFHQFAERFREYERRAAPSDASRHLKLTDILGLGDGSAKQRDEIRCLNEREAIFALDELVANYNKKRPCKMGEIEKLERFAMKYLLNNAKSIVLPFFTLFGVNIGIKCKFYLLAHLKQADTEADQLDFIYSMASPTGWNVLINEYAKKSMKFGTSSHQDSQLINRIAKLVPGLSRVEHLEYLNFNHPLNDPTNSGKVMKENKGLEVDSYQLEQGDKWHSKIVESLNQISESCKNLDQFYVNSVLSLARLKELGLLVEYLSDIHEHSVVLHKWLAATSFCQLMVRVKILDDDSTLGSQGTAIKLSVWHDDEKFSLENRRKLYSYVAQFQEIDSAAKEHSWCASVPNGRWRQSSEAMFVQTASNTQSMAMSRLKQFVKGLERTFESYDESMSQY